MRKDLQDITLWEKELGLLSINLEPKKPMDNKKVLLLNGSSGNFCLDVGTSPKVDPKVLSWSSNVDFYFSVDKLNTNILSWDNQYHSIYSNQSIQNNITQFYNLIKNFKILKEYSVINHSINILRIIREYTGKKFDNFTLDAFLLVLLSSKMECDVFENENFKLINLDNTDFINFLKKNKDNFEKIKEKFLKGNRIDIKPKLDLLFYHAIGQVFQEVSLNIEVENTQQQTLFDDDRSKYTTYKPIQFTSFYTPSYIARHIVEEAINNFVRNKNLKLIKKIKILDPACGSGEFFKEAIHQLRRKGFNGLIDIYGYDISENAVKMTKFALNMEIEFDKNIRFNIIQIDSLKTDWTKDVDFILMNPPFQMWEILNPEQQELIRQKTSKIFTGRFNLAGTFFYLSINSLSPDGVLGAVLPTFLWDGKSYIYLREFALKNGNFRIIGKLGSQDLFLDAMTDASIIIFDKISSKLKSDTTIIWTSFYRGISEEALKTYRIIRDNPKPYNNEANDISIYKASIKNESNLLPISYNAFRLRNNLEKRFKSISKIFNLYTGVITGLNKAFILDKNEKGILPKIEQNYFKPAATNDSIIDGALLDNYFVFFPYSKKSIKNITELKTKLSYYYKMYLFPNKQKLENRENVTKWWELTRQRNLDMMLKPKIITKKFGGLGSFAFDEFGRYVVVEGSILQFSDNYIDKISLTEYSEKDFYFAYLAYFSMPILKVIFEGISKQLAGGQWYYLTIKYLNNMKIFDLLDLIEIEKNYNNDKENLDNQLLRRLITIGQSISYDKSIESFDLELDGIQKSIFWFFQ